MSTTSKEWHSAPGLISDKLYRINSRRREGGDFQEIWLEVQHVPGQSNWAPARENDAEILISSLRGLEPGKVWITWSGRGASVRTLVRLTASSTTYETSTDEGATWRETNHPFALAERVLELDPS